MYQITGSLCLLMLVGGESRVYRTIGLIITLNVSVAPIFRKCTMSVVLKLCQATIVGEIMSFYGTIWCGARERKPREFPLVNLPLTLCLERAALLCVEPTGGPAPKSCGSGDVSSPPTPCQGNCSVAMKTHPSMQWGKGFSE